MTSPVALPLGDLARLRQAAYRLLGAALLSPDGAWVETVPAVARALLDEGEALAGFGFWPAWRSCLGRLAGVGAADLPALREAYGRHFVGTASGTRCPPTESGWAPADAMPWILADLEREYARAGLAPAAVATGADHAAVELEFMGLLCAEEAEAWERDEPAAAGGHLARQARFLDRHLGRWLRPFAERMAGDDPAGLFRQVAEAAWAFVAHDRDLVGGLRQGLRLEDAR